jgi:hypothetical protein
LTGGGVSAWLRGMGTKPKSGRGALYIIWGDKCEHILHRATAALRSIHPELPIEVVRLEHNDEGFHAKSRMFSLSPFRETVFFDADTLVLSRLDFAFENTVQFGLACCIDPHPWARQHAGVEGDTIEYNTGVLFFTEAARPVFEAWEALTERRERRGCNGKLDGKITGSDQGPFASAVAQCRFNPFVLPPNWNFLPKCRAFVAPIKVWHSHDDPPAGLLDLPGEVWMPEVRRAHTLPRTPKNLFRFLMQKPLP